VLCVITAEMLEDLHASHADGSFKRAMRRYVKPAVLLCDSCGVPSYVEWAPRIGLSEGFHG
jgi:hypothetical protein